MDQACRAHAFDVGAIRHQVQIRLKNFTLGIHRFQRQRTRDLFHLASDAARRIPINQPRQLHGDGGATLSWLTRDIGAPAATHQCKRIHTEVAVKPAVLLQQKRLNDVR